MSAPSSASSDPPSARLCASAKSGAEPARPSVQPSAVDSTRPPGADNPVKKPDSPSAWRWSISEIASRSCVSVSDCSESPAPAERDGAAADASSCVSGDLDAIRLRGRSGVIGVFLRFVGHDQTQLVLDTQLDLLGQAGVVAEEVADVPLALAQLITVIGEPGAGLADDAVVDAHIDEAALAGDPVPVEDVELGLLERRGDLVLHDLRACPVADRVLTLLEGFDA